MTTYCLLGGVDQRQAIDGGVASGSGSSKVDPTIGYNGKLGVKQEYKV